MSGLVRYALISALCIGLTPALLAQEPASHDFFPLEVGNLWIHQYSRDGAGYRVTDVVGTTEHDGYPAWLVQVDYLPFDGSDGPTASCAFQITDDDILLTAAIEGDVAACRPMGRHHDVEIDLSGPSTNVRAYWIAGTEHTVTTRTYPLTGYWGTVAQGIGVLGTAVGGLTTFSDNFPNKYLVYAEIGDETLGIHPSDYDWEPFNPLAVENEWIYFYYHSRPPPQQDVIVTYKHYRVISGEPSNDGYIFTLEVRVLDEDGVPSSDHVCTITRTSAGVDATEDPWPCQTYPDPNFGPFVPSFRQYGHAYYDILETSGLREIIRYSVSVTGEEHYQIWARGVGLSRFYRRSSGGPGSTHRTRDLRLEWALIDGQEYGTTPPVLGPGPGPGNGNGIPEVVEVQVFPNPVHGSSTLNVSLPSSGCDVRGALYDRLGRQVMELEQADSAPGSCQMEADTSGLASGVYILRLQLRDEAVSRLITVTR